MAPPANRWEYILDKAVKETGQHPARLCLGWPTIVSAAHRNRLALGAAETQRVAEVMWWSQFFPGEPFPEDWKPESNGACESNGSSTGQDQTGTGRYKSCWVLIKEKALRNRVSLDDLLDNYKGRLQFAIAGYLNEHGMDVTQFRAELLTWRDLFPDEVFVGIDPQTGAPNLRTSIDIRNMVEAQQAKKAASGSGNGAAKAFVAESLSNPNFEVGTGMSNYGQDELKSEARFEDAFVSDKGFHKPEGKSYREYEAVHDRSRTHQKDRYPTEQEGHRLRADDYEAEKRGKQESGRQRATAAGRDTVDHQTPAKYYYDEDQSLSKRPRASRDLFEDTPRRRTGHRSDYRDSGRSGPSYDLFDPENSHPKRGARGRGGYRGRGRGRVYDGRSRSRSPVVERKSTSRRERSPVREHRRSERVENLDVAHEGRRKHGEQERQRQYEHSDRRSGQVSRERVDARSDKREFKGKYQSESTHRAEPVRSVVSGTIGNKSDSKRRAEPMRSVVAGVGGSPGKMPERRERGVAEHREVVDLGAELRSYGAPLRKKSDRKSDRRHER